MTQDNTPIVRVQGLAKRFGDNEVLKHIDLEVNRGEVLVLMGPSGSGKTTLIRSLNFLELPDAGLVEVCGIELDTRTLVPGRQRRDKIQVIRRRTAMVFQAFNLFPHMTALENVMEGLLSVQGVAPKVARETAMTLLEKVGLAHKADAYPAKLSGGQKQRVAIARALAMKPEMIFFDEPTSALDPELRDEVLKVMRTLAHDGMTMVVVTHETRFAREVADRVVFMEAGQVVTDADPSLFFSDHAHERCRQFLGRMSD